MLNACLISEWAWNRKFDTSLLFLHLYMLVCFIACDSIERLFFFLIYQILRLIFSSLCKVLVQSQSGFFLYFPGSLINRCYRPRRSWAKWNTLLERFAINMLHQLKHNIYNILRWTFPIWCSIASYNVLHLPNWRYLDGWERETPLFAWWACPWQAEGVRFKFKIRSWLHNSYRFCGNVI